MRNYVGKKALALALAAIMGGSICADMTVFASETGKKEQLPDKGYEILSLQAAEGTCGDHLTWRFDEKTGTLTISGTGKMNDYEYYDDDYYDDDDEDTQKRPSLGPEQKEKITKVVIKNGVTSIGKDAFGGMNKLKSVELPASITSIGEGALNNCKSLEKITVSASSKKFTSKNGILYNKAKNTLLRYPEGKKGSTFTVPKHVKSIGPRAFKESTLKNIKIPDSVTNIGSAAFSGTTNLKDIKIPDSVKKIGAAAFCDSSLETIMLPNKLKRIEGSTFADCSLRTITVPKSVVGIEDFAFERSSVKKVVLSEGLKKIGVGAFMGCWRLESLIIPKSVTELGDDAYGSNEGSATGDKIKCYTNSAAHKYAKKNKIPYELLDGAKKKIKVSGIKISGISTKIAAGKKIKLTVKIAPSKATNKSVKWTSSNKRVATVNKKGIVTINKKAAGKSVTITATAADGSKKKATYKISVVKGVVKKVAISGNKSVKAGKTLNLKAKVTATKKANTKLKWTSSNKKYATVNSAGKVKTYKAGKGKKVKISAEATDGSGKKGTVTIEIK